MYLEGKAGGGPAEKREKAAQVAVTTSTKQGGGRGPGNCLDKSSHCVIAGIWSRRDKARSWLWKVYLGSALQGLCSQAEKAGLHPLVCHVKNKSGFREGGILFKRIIGRGPITTKEGLLFATKQVLINLKR